MSRIKIKNFGPVREGGQTNDGWIDIKKVTVFIGNQGSGKSTVAKLISTFMWIEKALVRGDYDKKWFERKNNLKNQYLNYHRLENYLKNSGVDKTVIEYEGDAFSIVYRNDSLVIKEVHNEEYLLPQIMYVPAERNFITYVKTPRELFHCDGYACCDVYRSGGIFGIVLLFFACQTPLRHRSLPHYR